MWHSQLLEVSPGKEKPWIWETWAEMRSPSQDTCKWHEKWVLIFTCLACNLSLGYLTKGCLVHFWWEDSALSLKLSFFLLPTLPQHTLSLIWNFKWLCKIAHVPWCFNFPPKSIGMLPVSAWQIRAVDLCQANQSFFFKTQTSYKKVPWMERCSVRLYGSDPDKQIFWLAEITCGSQTWLWAWILSAK